MSIINLSVKHGRIQDEARNRLEKAVAEVSRSFGAMIRHVEWAADRNRVRIDGATHTLDDVPTIDRRRKHKIEVVIDRVVVKPDGRSRINGTVENALALGKGAPGIGWIERVGSERLAEDTAFQDGDRSADQGVSLCHQGMHQILRV